jgi:hypothetical protein
MSNKKPINLMKVAEALAAEGLDPSLEIAQALKRELPVMDREGRQVFDDSGQPVMVPAIPEDLRLKTMVSLLEYCQPKLKATEVKVSGSVDLTSEQLDARVTALLEKALKR